MEQLAWALPAPRPAQPDVAGGTLPEADCPGPWLRAWVEFQVDSRINQALRELAAAGGAPSRAPGDDAGGRQAAGAEVRRVAEAHASLLAVVEGLVGEVSKVPPLEREQAAAEKARRSLEEGLKRLEGSLSAVARADAEARLEHVEGALQGHAESLGRLQAELAARGEDAGRLQSLEERWGAARAASEGTEARLQQLEQRCQELTGRSPEARRLQRLEQLWDAAVAAREGQEAKLRQLEERCEQRPGLEAKLQQLEQRLQRGPGNTGWEARAAEVESRLDGLTADLSAVVVSQRQAQHAQLQLAASAQATHRLEAALEDLRGELLRRTAPPTPSWPAGAPAQELGWPALPAPVLTSPGAGAAAQASACERLEQLEGELAGSLEKQRAQGQRLEGELAALSERHRAQEERLEHALEASSERHRLQEEAALQQERLERELAAVPERHRAQEERLERALAAASDRQRAQEERLERALAASSERHRLQEEGARRLAGEVRAAAEKGDELEMAAKMQGRLQRLEEELGQSLERLRAELQAAAARGSDEQQPLPADLRARVERLERASASPSSLERLPAGAEASSPRPLALGRVERMERELAALARELAALAQRAPWRTAPDDSPAIASASEQRLADRLERELASAAERARASEAEVRSLAGRVAGMAESVVRQEAQLAEVWQLAESQGSALARVTHVERSFEASVERADADRAQVAALRRGLETECSTLRSELAAELDSISSSVRGMQRELQAELDSISSSMRGMQRELQACLDGRAAADAADLQGRLERVGRELQLVSEAGREQGLLAEERAAAAAGAERQLGDRLSRLEQAAAGREGDERRLERVERQAASLAEAQRRQEERMERESRAAGEARDRLVELEGHATTVAEALNRQGHQVARLGREAQELQELPAALEQLRGRLDELGGTVEDAVGQHLPALRSGQAEASRAVAAVDARALAAEQASGRLSERLDHLERVLADSALGQMTRERLQHEMTAVAKTHNQELRGHLKEWQCTLERDLTAAQKRASTELRVEVRTAIRNEAAAVAALDEQLWLTDQRLGQRIDQLTHAGTPLGLEDTPAAGASSPEGGEERRGGCGGPPTPSGAVSVVSRPRTPRGLPAAPAAARPRRAAAAAAGALAAAAAGCEEGGGEEVFSPMAYLAGEALTRGLSIRSRSELAAAEGGGAGEAGRPAEAAGPEVHGPRPAGDARGCSGTAATTPPVAAFLLEGEGQPRDELDLAAQGEEVVHAHRPGSAKGLRRGADNAGGRFSWLGALVAAPAASADTGS